MKTLKVQMVKELGAFQQLTLTLVQEMWRRGYDLNGATDERIMRTATTFPPTRQLLNELGYEWNFPPEEQHRISEVVRFNMALREGNVYMWEHIMDIEVNPCPHGKPIYCAECWQKEQQVAQVRRKKQ